MMECKVCHNGEQLQRGQTCSGCGASMMTLEEDSWALLYAIPEPVKVIATEKWGTPPNEGTIKALTDLLDICSAFKWMPELLEQGLYAVASQLEAGAYPTTLKKTASPRGWGSEICAYFTTGAGATQPKPSKRKVS